MAELSNKQVQWKLANHAIVNAKNFDERRPVIEAFLKDYSVLDEKLPYYVTKKFFEEILDREKVKYAYNATKAILWNLSKGLKKSKPKENKQAKTSKPTMSRADVLRNLLLKFEKTSPIPNMEHIKQEALLLLPNGARNASDAQWIAKEVHRSLNLQAKQKQSKKVENKEEDDDDETTESEDGDEGDAKETPDESVETPDARFQGLLVDQHSSSDDEEDEEDDEGVSESQGQNNRATTWVPSTSEDEVSNLNLFEQQLKVTPSVADSFVMHELDDLASSTDSLVIMQVMRKYANKLRQTANFPNLFAHCVNEGLHQLSITQSTIPQMLRDKYMKTYCFDLFDTFHFKDVEIDKYLHALSLPEGFIQEIKNQYKHT